MSWQLGSFALVTLAIGAGLLWYERSRPPSQIVALVAVLAALAVAGRIVLAPIPNVVATTDIVIISGYVLGPAPGFAVGALGGLISNFWLGQGAWTPWQMLAWGASGIGGAVLWRITRGRAGRLALALTCGAAGLAFGAWMNLQTLVSYGGDISLERYLALQVRAIPFDLAHMTGNILFALIAGPAMIAALRRFRERFEWRMVSQPLGIGLVVLSLGTILFAGTATERARAAEKVPAEATDAANWLRGQQNTDGGFAASVDGSSSVTVTARAMLALAAARINPLDVKNSGKTPYDYLVAHRKQLKRPNEIALGILALHTVGKNPRKFEGRDLMTALRVRQTRNGSFVTRSNVGDVNVTAWAALAFRSGGAEPAAQRAVQWLYTAQNRKNGGWGIAPGARSDPDSTGTALMAIPKKARKRIRQAIAYLRDRQKSSGGFYNMTVNSQSTTQAVLGQVAAGKGPNYLKSHGNSALDFLKNRQHSDGSVWYSKESDQTRIWVTADATTALAASPPPIPAPPRAPRPKPDPPAETSPGTASSGTTSSGTTYNPGPGSVATPSAPSSSGSGSGSGSGRSPSSTGGTGSSQGGVPSTTTPDSPLPPVPAVTPVIPSEALLAASQPGPSPSPLLAILICLAVSGGLCGGTIWLVRRFRW